ncbi:MAG: hypothetical protein AB8F74_05980 [Saprospiraceae bacterium]
MLLIFIHLIHLIHLTKTQIIKKILGVGTIAYLVLGIIALWFYLERTAFLDISFHLFYILKDGDFAIQNNRFGAVVTQVFPLLGSKIGLSLSAIMKWYSVGFVLYYFTIFFLCTKVLKSPRFGLVMLLFSTLMVTDTFYWIQSEFPQGLALLIFYFALLYQSKDYNKNQLWLTHLLLAVLNIALVFFHPLLVFPYLFSVLFLFLKNRTLNNPVLKIQLIKSAILFFSILVIKSIFFKTEYESNSMQGVNNFVKLFPDYFSINSNKEFLIYLFRDYYFLLIALIGMVYYYFKNGKVLHFGLLVSFFFGYLLLVNVSYPEGSEQFYMENLYLPLSLFVIVPLAFELNWNKYQRYYFPMLIFIIAIRLMHIGFNHQFYSERINYLNNYLEETSSLTQKKIIASEANFPMDTLLMTWASPYEFWLLSTIKEDQTRSILISKNANKIKWRKMYNKKFLTAWRAFDYSELPEPYFILRDTTYYQFME